MLEQRKLEQQPSAGPMVAANTGPASRPQGLRGWLLAHYRFLYAMDLILLYLSSMFYITARIVTGRSSVPARLMLVAVIGSGIIAALPFVTGENFEKDFAGALAAPRSKKFKRVEIIVLAALLLILVAVLAFAISHGAHRIQR
jgi:hypothetical protein